MGIVNGPQRLAALASRAAGRRSGRCRAGASWSGKLAPQLGGGLRRALQRQRALLLPAPDLHLDLARPRGRACPPSGAAGSPAAPRRRTSRPGWRRGRRRARRAPPRRARRRAGRPPRAPPPPPCRASPAPRRTAPARAATRSPARRRTARPRPRRSGPGRCRRSPSRCAARCRPRRGRWRRAAPRTAFPSLKMFPTSIAGSIRISAPAGARVARLDPAHVGEARLEVPPGLHPAQMAVGLVGAGHQAVQVRAGPRRPAPARVRPRAR